MITTDVPGCREALVPERSGLLVPPKDARRLADAITRLLRNLDLRDELLLPTDSPATADLDPGSGMAIAVGLALRDAPDDG